jgi:CII-binding regulator of phage lambda lysogenization HflD
MKKNRLVDQIKQDWKEMAQYLSKESKDNAIREELQDELKWLKKQIDYYADQKDAKLMTEYYNEVVDHMNEKLHIPKQKQFKKRKTT